ncbi:MAG: APC family permease [Haloferacaceae archaeon]
MTDSGSALEQRLGLLDAVLLSFGGMVGSAIFIFPGTTGRLVGPASVGAWLLAGVLMVAVALCYTELALAFPRAGAIAVFPYESFGPYPSIRAFASYLEGVGYTIGWVFAITISALAAANYLAVVVPAAAGHTVGVALAAIVLAAVVNLLGVTVASRTNLLLSALLLAVLLAFVATGLSAASPANYRPVVTGGTWDFFAAVQVAITGYGAWTAIPSAVEEIRDPSRTVPRAILLSLALTTVVYTAIVAAVHGVVSPSQFVEGSVAAQAPLRVAADALALPWLRALLAVAAVVAIFTTMLIGMLSAGRVLLALGRNDTLPAVFETTSDRFSVPWVAIAFVAVVAGALATVPQYFYQLLVIAAVVGTGLPYAINVLSFVGFRYYRRDVTPSFRAPGGYALPVVAFVVLAIAMLGLGSTEVLWSVGALVALSAYFVVRTARNPEILRGVPAAESDPE